MADREEIISGQTGKSIPLLNDPTGNPIILRRFQFRFPPDLEEFPSKREIADQQRNAVELFLWKDELRLVEDLRVTIDTEKKTYDIFATCQPKAGAKLYEKPKTLQEIIKPSEGRPD
jgi:hypothetical protein